MKKQGRCRGENALTLPSLHHLKGKRVLWILNVAVWILVLLVKQCRGWVAGLNRRTKAHGIDTAGTLQKGKLPGPYTPRAVDLKTS